MCPTADGGRKDVGPPMSLTAWSVSGKCRAGSTPRLGGGPRRRRIGARHVGLHWPECRIDKMLLASDDGNSVGLAHWVALSTGGEDGTPA